jgi:hypothetical protein
MQWVPGVLSLGVKGLGRKVDHPPPSSAEGKNAWTIPQLPNTSSRRGAQLSTGTTLLYFCLLNYICRTRNTQGRDEKFIQNFSRKA